MSDPKVDPRAQLRHDLRTPLHQIIGYAELLEDEVRDAGQKKYVADLQKMRAAARRALGVGAEGLPAGDAPAQPVVFREPAADPPPRVAAPDAAVLPPLRRQAELIEPGSVSLLVRAKATTASRTSQ